VLRPLTTTTRAAAAQVRTYLSNHVDPTELSAAGMAPMQQQQQPPALPPPAISMGPGALGGMSEEQLQQMQAMQMQMQQQAASDGDVMAQMQGLAQMQGVQ
jgi:hypothetical protein